MPPSRSTLRSAATTVAGAAPTGSRSYTPTTILPRRRQRSSRIGPVAPARRAAASIALAVLGVERGDGLARGLNQAVCVPVHVQRPAAVAEQHAHAGDAAGVHRFRAFEALRQREQVGAGPSDAGAWPSG